MQIKDLLYKTPEMTEEKLLSIIKSHLDWIKRDLIDRIYQLHREVSIEQAFLNEYDLIQDKKSLLTASQRNTILGFVGTCMILMTKGDESGN